MSYELPERMNHLDVFKGFPIPYTTLVVKGVPDFKTTNMARWHECVAGKLCAICGSSLGYWVWWIGGPNSTAHGAYFDPPMHEECARFAAATCPFIARTREYAQRAKDHGPDVPIVTHPMQTAERMFLSKSRRDAFRVNLQTSQISRGAAIYTEEISIRTH